MRRNQAVFVTGDKELDRKLSTLEPKVQKKVARKGMRKAGKVIQAAAKSNLASNQSVETGELSKGIRVRAMKRSRSRIGIEIATTERREGKSIEGKRFGGAQLEAGTKHTQAKPFLRPAGYDNEDEVLSLITDSIGDAIDDLARASA